jgi:hypothetical protein
VNVKPNFTNFLEIFFQYFVYNILYNYLTHVVQEVTKLKKSINELNEKKQEIPKRPVHISLRQFTTFCRPGLVAIPKTGLLLAHASWIRALRSKNQGWQNAPDRRRGNGAQWNDLSVVYASGP